MAQLLVRNIDEDLKARLKRRALAHGNSMEEEVRQILHCALNESVPSGVGFGRRIAGRFSKQGLTSPLPELRGQKVFPPSFGEG